jgi:hypothetical protein
MNMYDNKINTLAQKLFEEDGHSGDLFESDYDKKYVDKAFDILEKDEKIRLVN